MQLEVIDQPQTISIH